MLNLWAPTPTSLWVELGKIFFSKDREKSIDYVLGDRRFVSIVNTFTIAQWPKDWTGGALFHLVGYSPEGSKMTILRKTYLDEERFAKFKEKVKDTKKKGYSAIGMQFNMSFEKKGGCLSSMHLVRNRGENTLFIHGKVAEVPRKFMADLKLVKDILHELDIWPMKVVFMYSSVFFSIVTLRAYIPVFSDSVLKYTKGIAIIEKRNYHAGIIERLTSIRKELLRKDPEGCLKTIEDRTGEWK